MLHHKKIAVSAGSTWDAELFKLKKMYSKSDLIFHEKLIVHTSFFLGLTSDEGKMSKWKHTVVAWREENCLSL